MFSQRFLGRYQAVSPSALALCRTPTAQQVGTTKRWAPIPHYRLLTEIVDRLAESGAPLVDTPEIYVRPDGLDWIGTFTVKGLTQYTVPGYNKVGNLRNQVIVRNRNDGTGSLQLVAGHVVRTCDNGCIWGDTAVGHRHSRHLDWRDAVKRWCQQVDVKLNDGVRHAQRLINTPCSDEQAAHRLIETRRRRRIPAYVLDKAWSFWRSPPHEEFKPRNAWSLYNAVTEAAKLSPLAAQTRALLAL